MVRRLVLVTLAFLLASCRASEPSPGLSATQVTPSAVTPEPSSRVPSAAQAGTARDESLPADPFRTPEQAEPLPTPTPSSTPEPTPSLTPTLRPSVRLEEAQRSWEDGDYETAIALWEEARQQADPAEKGELTISLARAYARVDRHHGAIALLAGVVTEAAPSEELSQAAGLLASSHEALGDWDAAIAAFERYLELEDWAAPYVRWHMAKAHQALDEDEQAEEQLAAIDLIPLPVSQRAEVLEELATVRRRLGRHDAALEAYQHILDFSTVPDYRAHIFHQKGETLREAGREDKAEELFGKVLQEHPESAAAYSSLLALDEMGIALVTDLERGAILYRARQYEACIEVLERHLLSEPVDEAARAHYYLGLAYEGLERYAQAFREFDLVIRRYPQDPLVGDAWMSMARTEASYGGDPSGLYQEFARLHPDHPRAPEALWRAAAALERAGEWERAAGFYRKLHTTYPGDSRAREALFREGLAAYALRDVTGAHELWARALQADLAQSDRARVLTWLGLAARAMADASAASDHWREAVSISPTSYYGLRARDLQRGEPLRLAPDASPTLPDDRLDESEWGEILAWAHGWSQESTGVGARVSSDPLAGHAQALWFLDWQSEAAETCRLLRDQVRDDPDALVALARLCDGMGMHSVTISCAERLLELGRKAAAGEPPRALLKLSYPTKFGHLVSAQAEGEDIDPLLFLALIRQESRFNPRAVSWAGAVGLGQVMPSTGEWIASRIGPDSYSRALLFRPVVSVRYGVWFMARLLDMFDRDWVAALVGYNAGPGNVSRWTNDQPIADHDLFYETIPVAEAQRYVRLVYENYRTYEAVYRESGEIGDGQ